MIKALNSNNTNKILHITSNVFITYRHLCSILEQNSNTQYPLIVSEILLLFQIEQSLQSNVKLTTYDLMNDNLYTSNAHLFYLLNALALKSCIKLESFNEDCKSFNIKLMTYGIQAINYFNSLKINPNVKHSLIELGSKLSIY